MEGGTARFGWSELIHHIENNVGAQISIIKYIRNLKIEDVKSDAFKTWGNISANRAIAFPELVDMKTETLDCANEATQRD